MNRGAWQAIVHGIARVGHNLVTKPVPPFMGLETKAAAAAAKSLQLCLTLCNPIDCSLPGSPVPGILQARTLEWVAISFSRRSSQPRDPIHVSCTDKKFFTAEPPGKPDCSK